MFKSQRQDLLSSREPATLLKSAKSTVDSSRETNAPRGITRRRATRVSIGVGAADVESRLHVSHVSRAPRRRRGTPRTKIQGERKERREEKKQNGGGEEVRERERKGKKEEEEGRGQRKKEEREERNDACRKDRLQALRGSSQRVEEGKRNEKKKNEKGRRRRRRRRRRSSDVRTWGITRE